VDHRWFSLLVGHATVIALLHFDGTGWAGAASHGPDPLASAYFCGTGFSKTWHVNAVGTQQAFTCSRCAAQVLEKA